MKAVKRRHGTDAETFGLSHDPAFIELINRSWAAYLKKGGVSSEEAKRRLLLGKPTRKARPAR